MNIGELSKKLNINTSLIRYYEEKGLLGQIKRHSNGYRIYDDNDIKKLKWTLWCKSCGLSINDIINVNNLEDEQKYDEIISILDYTKQKLKKEYIEVLAKMTSIDNKIIKYNQIKEK